MYEINNYTMYLIGNNDAGFQWDCKAYSAKQAIGYAKHLYGYKIRIRDIREVK
jgi:hypothetical protein